MKKILFCFALFAATPAFADNTAVLMGLGMSPELATKVDALYSPAVIAQSGVTSVDGDVATACTATPLQNITGSSGVQAHLALSQDVASAQGADLIATKTRAAAGSFDANTIVSAGDDILKIRAFAANGASYDEAAQILLEVGPNAVGASADMNGQIKFLTTPDGSATPTLALTITSAQDATFAGAITSTSTGSLGWSYVTGANTACTTTCTSAAVFGVDLAAGASAPVIVAANSASADACVCAGAS